jgi:DNA repair ATPase RecN
MTDDHRTEHELIADRVALMRGKRQAAAASKPNYQMYGVIGAIAICGFLYVAIVFGGDSGEASNNLRPEQAITYDDDPDRGRSSKLFGDTSIAPEPAKPDPEIAALKAQISNLKDELDDAMAETKKSSDAVPQIPEAYQAELDRLNSTMEEMRATYDAQIASYQQYIEGLEQQFKDSKKLPARPVTLSDSKWLRAQQITESNDTERAARLAAPSMVFDSRSTKEQEQKDEDIEAIERVFGTSFPDDAEITPPPAE